MDTLSWVPGGKKWAAPPVRIAGFFGAGGEDAGKSLRFARNSLEKYAENARNGSIGTMETPGTVYHNLKMG